MEEPLRRLDLPPELLLMVLDYYVAAVGVREAWKHRLVCKAFAEYIKDVLASKQPLEVLRNPENRKLIERLLPDILQKSLGREAIPRLLPDLILRIVDNVLALRGSATNTDRDAAKAEVCKIAGLGTAAWRLCFLPKSLRKADRFATASIDNETLCVAIGIDDRALIRVLLKAGVSMFKECKLFGHTWEFAAKCGSFATFQFLISLTQIPTEGHQRSMHNNLLRNRMIALLEDPFKVYSRREECALALLNLGAAQLGHPTRGTSIQLFKAALKCGAEQFIAALLPMPPTDDFDNTWSIKIRMHFLTSSEADISKRAAIGQHLLNQGIFDQNNINQSEYAPAGQFSDLQSLREFYLHPRYVAQSLLDIAVSSQDRHLVDTVIGLGAVPDRTNLPEKPRRYVETVYEQFVPLAFAVKHDLSDIAKSLLRAGACPTMGKTIGQAVKLTMKHCGPELQDIMLYALRDRDSNLWSDPRPR